MQYFYMMQKKLKINHVIIQNRVSTILKITGKISLVIQSLLSMKIIDVIFLVIICQNLKSKNNFSCQNSSVENNYIFGELWKSAASIFTSLTISHHHNAIIVDKQYYVCSVMTKYSSEPFCDSIMIQVQCQKPILSHLFLLLCNLENYFNSK